MKIFICLQKANCEPIEWRQVDADKFNQDENECIPCYLFCKKHGTKIFLPTFQNVCLLTRFDYLTTKKQVYKNVLNTSGFVY